MPSPSWSSLSSDTCSASRSTSSDCGAPLPSTIPVRWSARRPPTAAKRSKWPRPSSFGTRLVDNSRITPLRLPIQEQGKENLDTVVHPLLHPRHAGQQLPARYQYRRTGDNGHIEIGSRRNALPDRCRTVGRKKIKSVGWKPLILGIILWITVSILSLLVIMHY